MMLYQRRHSSAESWDPRAKLPFLLGMMISMILGHVLWWKSSLLILLLLLWVSAGLSWRLMLRTMAPVALLFLSTMLFHSFVTGGGWQTGLAICLQIAGVVAALGFLIHTTPPTLLAGGLEALLSPLKRLGVPVHQGVMLFTIALRFLPVLAEEFTRIRQAQIARGAGFHRRGIIRRAGGLLPMLIPLFIRSLVRAQELATAMEARCYQGDAGRTPLVQGPLRWQEGALVGVGVVFVLATLAITLLL